MADEQGVDFTSEVLFHTIGKLLFNTEWLSQVHHIDHVVVDSHLRLAGLVDSDVQLSTVLYKHY